CPHLRARGKLEVWVTTPERSTMETYQTYRPIAYPPSDKGMPVPGWDMRRLLAGSPTIAIGAIPSQSKAMIIQGRSPFSSRGIVIQGKQAAYHGLGLDMTIQTPVGPQQVSIPIEDAMNAAMAGAVSQM